MKHYVYYVEKNSILTTCTGYFILLMIIENLIPQIGVFALFWKLHEISKKKKMIWKHEKLLKQVIKQYEEISQSHPC